MDDLIRLMNSLDIHETLKVIADVHEELGYQDLAPAYRYLADHRKLPTSWKGKFYWRLNYNMDKAEDLPANDLPRRDLEPGVSQVMDSLSYAMEWAAHYLTKVTWAPAKFKYHEPAKTSSEPDTFQPPRTPERCNRHHHLYTHTLISFRDLPCRR